MRGVVSAVLLGLLFSVSLRAQSTNASLTGRITDPKKAVITEATITVINTGTGIHYQGLTNVEAADVMSISVEALESLLARGRRTLRTQLRAVAPELLGDA